MNRKYNKAPKNPHIKLIISTWVKDSHGLYDYQANAQHYSKEKFYLQNQCRIYRNTHSQHTTIQPTPESKRVAEQNVHVANLVVSRERGTIFKLLPPINKVELQTNLSNYPHNLSIPFLVITKDYQDKEGSLGFPLSPGNIIKLGRAEYMVIQLKNNHQTLTLRGTNHFQSTNGTISAMEGKYIGNQCKVCLSDEQTPDNPLFNPCKCKGTCAVIHVDCLRQWINSKVKKELQGISVSYNFTKFQCQICKSSFPKSVQIEEKEIQMMTIGKPDKPYIIIQSLFSTIEGRQERSLHLILADEDQIIKIGRGHTCQIRVTDISVSRNHAEIVFIDNQFLLRDSGSKFGTLVKFDKQIEITNEKPVKIQLGRTLLDFQHLGGPIQVDTE